MSAGDGEEGLSAGDDLGGGWEMLIVTLRFGTPRDVDINRQQR